MNEGVGGVWDLDTAQSLESERIGCVLPLTGCVTLVFSPSGLVFLTHATGSHQLTPGSLSGHQHSCIESPQRGLAHSRYSLSNK